MTIKLRDAITIVNDEGVESEYFVEALFDVDDESFVLIRKVDNSMMLAKIEEESGEQYLVPVENDGLKANLQDAYQIAVEANTGK